MGRVNLLVNMALVVLVIATPFAIAYGLEKQERIETASRGQ